MTTDFSEAQMTRAFENPAIFTNAVMCVHDGSFVRLCFIDQPRTDMAGVPRAAVMMDFKNAAQLRDILDNVIKSAEAGQGPAMPHPGGSVGLNFNVPAASMAPDGEILSAGSLSELKAKMKAR